ncbi:MAG: hypothetical protein JF587_10980 [Catenulisporales bacterium]|jgi:hypothetical protein|nr:hypothetical protein [Catenulisporales bacterium]
MEFAEWVVSGLDQYRLGQLPGGDALYQAVSAGLGGHAVLDTYMNSGDQAAREQLVQAITQAMAADPTFEQRVRQAAASAQSTGAAAPAEPSFFKTTNGLLVLVAAAVVVVGGGIGLGVGLSGDSSSGLAGMLKGTWTCGGEGSGSVTIGDGTWSIGGEKGTWKQSGGKATVSNSAHPGDDIIATGMPSGAGPYDITVAGAKDTNDVTHIKGTVSAHKLTVTLVAIGDSPSTITCTK